MTCDVCGLPDTYRGQGDDVIFRPMETIQPAEVYL